MRRRKIFLLLLIAGSIVFFSRCLHFKSNQDPRGKAYVGSGECQSCHPKIFEDYLHNPHYLSVRRKQEPLTQVRLSHKLIAKDVMGQELTM
ncbi:MAG: hypothetical protein C5B59_17550 [Bacteroidetes bacterium]|nr:MAG: hypothetical protein C5B59_17550 [Bacteroidota bacterium]